MDKSKWINYSNEIIKKLNDLNINNEDINYYNQKINDLIENENDIVFLYKYNRIINMNY